MLVKQQSEEWRSVASMLDPDILLHRVTRVQVAHSLFPLSAFPFLCSESRSRRRIRIRKAKNVRYSLESLASDAINCSSKLQGHPVCETKLFLFVPKLTDPRVLLQPESTCKYIFVWYIYPCHSQWMNECYASPSSFFLPPGFDSRFFQHGPHGRALYASQSARYPILSCSHFGFCLSEVWTL